MDLSWSLDPGRPWEAVHVAGDEVLVIVDVWSSCDDLAVDLYSDHRHVAQVHGPYNDEHKMAMVVAFFREIYQAGVNASGVENRTKESIARWIETLAKDNIFKLADDAQLLALADGIREERFADERDRMLSEAFRKCGLWGGLLQPVVVPVRKVLRVRATLLDGAVAPATAKVRLRTLKTVNVQ